MALRFRQTFTLFPGVRINISKAGISTSIGIPGASVNIGRQGIRATVGAPGTGISYSNLIVPARVGSAHSGHIRAWIPILSAHRFRSDPRSDSGASAHPLM
ncbi:DUF4236 domain-containing protein [Cohaesibacter marisflavi]|uniref:DUF4236 domain-containing protein n=1 Tax=Cohaesibacter marisflavi TaxID=655353 RepID=UPI000B7C9C77